MAIEDCACGRSDHSLLHAILERLDYIVAVDDDILAAAQALVPIVAGLESTGAKILSGVNILEAELAAAGTPSQSGQQALALLKTLGTQLQTDGQNAAAVAANLPTVPLLTSLSVASGPAAGGTIVTVTGAGFTGATAVNFGTAPGTGLVVVSDTELTVASPAGTQGATVDVTVVTPNGTTAVVAADSFGYV